MKQMKNKKLSKCFHLTFDHLFVFFLRRHKHPTNCAKFVAYFYWNITSKHFIWNYLKRQQRLLLKLYIYRRYNFFIMTRTKRTLKALYLTLKDLSNMKRWFRFRCPVGSAEITDNSWIDGGEVINREHILTVINL